jgi:hypothetical protein
MFIRQQTAVINSMEVSLVEFGRHTLRTVRALFLIWGEARQ